MVSVTRACIDLLPFSFPDFAGRLRRDALRTCESLLSRSLFIGISIAEPGSLEGFGQLIKQKCDLLLVYRYNMSRSSH
jgi:hypothetical protein